MEEVASADRGPRACECLAQSDEEWMHTRAQGFEFLAASGRYPSFAKVLGSHDMQGFELDFDALFERGLKALLDGFTPLFE